MYIQTYVERAASEGVLKRVTAELAALTRVTAGSPRLAKVLADVNLHDDARRSLVADLTRSALHAVTTELLANVMSGRRTARVSASALASLLTDLTAEFAFAAADHEYRLEAVESGLHQVAVLIRSNNDLRNALVDPAITDDAKEALTTELLAGKVDYAVVELVHVLIALDHGRGVDAGVEELSVLAAARRDLVVANVQTAVELDDDHRSRLNAKLSEVVGKPVASRYTVDPSILGSVVVRIGDEVFDGSVRHRLAQARQAVAGAL